MNFSTVLIIPAALYAIYRFTRPTFTMYHATWCGHCKQAMPAWSEFTYPGVVIRSVEQRFNFERQVRGYPTFVYRSGTGEEAVYHGPRSVEGWAAFLDSQTKVPA